MRAVIVPFPQFVGLDGLPLEDGNIYIGTADENPETNPVAIFSDAAGANPLSQPVQTSGGYAVRLGKPIAIYVDGPYSITVKDSNGVLVYSEPNNIETTAVTGAENIVDDLGAVNDGTGDQSTVINAAFAGSGRVFIPSGTYNVDQLIVIDTTNLDVYGVPGGTIITSATLTNIMSLVSMDNVNFYGIRFASTSTSDADSTGVVYGSSPTITDSSFNKCEFSAGTQTSGLTITGTGTISNFTVNGNRVDGVGGYGIYVEAASWTDCKITDNIINETGNDGAETGEGIWIGAGGSGNTVSRNAFYDCKTSCIHMTGTADSTVSDNVFHAMPRTCELMTSDGDDGTNVNMTFENNRSLSRPVGGGVTLYAQTAPKFSNNRWLLTNAFYLNNVTQLKATNDTIDTVAANAVKIEGTSSNNQWIGGVITNADATDDAGNVTILANGAGITDTQAIGAEVYKTAAGALVAGQTSAEVPTLVYCGGDSTTSTDGTIVSFTPTAIFATMTAVAYTSTGSAVKNGSVVSYYASFVFTNKGSGGAGETLEIGGFLYNPTAGYGNAVYYTDLTGISGAISGAFFTEQLRPTIAGGANVVQLKRSDMTNTAVIIFTGQYFTND
jgi:hypothetical protein